MDALRDTVPFKLEKIYELCKGKKLKSKEAWYLLKISKNTFYRLVKLNGALNFFSAVILSVEHNCLSIEVLSLILLQVRQL